MNGPEEIAVRKDGTMDNTNTETSKILTAAPATMEEGKTLVWFRRKKVPDAKMYRAVFVPAWEQPEEVTKLSDVFKVAVDDAVRIAAGNILRRAIENSTDKEGKELLEQVPHSLLTFAEVVKEMEATQTNDRLDSTIIATWYDASKTKQARDVAYNDEKKSKKLRDVFLSLASNNPGIIPSLAEKMLSYIAEEDTNSVVCAAVVKRLARIQQTAVSADEL